MQLTIDSSEPLSKVTTVLGALYGVELVVAEGSQIPTGSSRSRRETSNGTTSSTRRPAKRNRSANRRVDASVVRQWALEQGLTVNSRGQLPKAVLAAYNEQHG